MPSCVCTDVVLYGIISKLQCSVFYVKRAMNRVLSCAITLTCRERMAFGCCCVLFVLVILKKGDSAKVSLHYFALFQHSVKLVIYAFRGHYLSNIDVLYAWMILNSLTFYVIACCVRSAM